MQRIRRMRMAQARRRRSHGHRSPPISLCMALIALALLLPAAALAAPPPPPSGWGVIASGGTIAQRNGTQELHATAGQASPVGLTTNAAYQLAHGYWAPSALHTIYLPLVLRSA